MPKEMQQHEARQEYDYTDQHGRPWACIVDVRCQPHIAPCTPMQPKGWDAPILPPGNRVHAHPRQLGTLVIDYDAWLESARVAEATHAIRLRETANQMFGEGAVDAMNNRNVRLMAEVGDAPESSLFIEACMAGESKWVLGLAPVEQVPSWAKPILHTLPQYRPKLSLTVASGRFVDDVVEEPEPAFAGGGSMFGDDAGEEETPVRRGPGRPRKVPS